MKEFNRYLKVKGHTSRTHSTLLSQQNGVAEKMNWTLMESTRSMMSMPVSLASIGLKL